MPPTPELPHGLCDACRHARRVLTRRGSVFLLCGRSVDDPAFPRYPPLPVLRCAGFERTGDTVADSADPSHLPDEPEPA